MERDAEMAITQKNGIIKQVIHKKNCFKSGCVMREDFLALERPILRRATRLVFLERSLQIWGVE